MEIYLNYILTGVLCVTVVISVVMLFRLYKKINREYVLSYLILDHVEKICSDLAKEYAQKNKQGYGR